jgi:hypothetical protein
MAVTASIGALQFALVRRREMRAPALAGEPLLRIEGAVVQRVRGQHATVLVVDHRADPKAGEPTSVELWRPLVSGEGGVRSLLVLLDTRGTKKR